MDENIDKIIKGIEPEEKPENGEPVAEPIENEHALRKCANCGKEFGGEPGSGLTYCDGCSTPPVRTDMPL